MKGMNDVVRKIEETFDFSSDSQKDAVSLLKADHRKVEGLFQQWERARSHKQNILDQIIRELAIHASVEEDLVYPLLEESSKEKVSEKTGEAEEEHHVMKLILAELADVRADARQTRAKVMVLKEMVLHHVKEEERTLLPALKRSGVDIDRLGQQILSRKKQLLSDVSRGGGIGKNKGRQRSRTSTASRRVAGRSRKSA